MMMMRDVVIATRVGAAFQAALAALNRLRQGYGGPPKLYAKAEGRPYEIAGA